MQPRTPTLIIGETITHFTITDYLGGGGMGEVYKARDTNLDRTVALKILPPTATPPEQARFGREARAAAKIHHPNVATIFEVGIGQRGPDDINFIAMEYVDGESLHQYLSRSQDLQQTLVILRDVAEGLDAAHRHHVVHRDLKPANIMITSDGRAKIVDFGLAKHLPLPEADANAITTATASGQLLGTYPYMSPEQASGKAIDHRTDIFSFGSILYEAITHRKAFAADSIPALLYNIVHVEPDTSMISAPLQSVISTCIRKKPDERYQNASDIAAELTGIITKQRTHILSTPPAGARPEADRLKTNTTLRPDSEGATIRRDDDTQRRPSRSVIAPRTLLLLALLAVVAYAGIARYQNKQFRDAGRAVLRAATTDARPQTSSLPACGLTASPPAISYGASAQLRWSSTNAVSVVISPDIGKVASTGSMTVSPQTTTKYEIVARGADGSIAKGSVTLPVAKPPNPPKWVGVSGSLIASPDTVQQGQTPVLKWNSFNATRVIISPDIGAVPLEGSIAVTPLVTTTYTMTVSNPTSAATGSATVYVAPPTTNNTTFATSVTCTAATQLGVTGTQATDSSSCYIPAGSTITSAALTYVLDDAGEIAINGQRVFASDNVAHTRNGTIELPTTLFLPDKNFFVSVTARAATPPSRVYGRAEVKVSFSTNEKLLIGVDARVDPPIIDKGESAHLNWSSTNAATIAIEPGISSAGPNGTITVSPTQTTTYTITATNASGGRARTSTTLVVK